MKTTLTSALALILSATMALAHAELNTALPAADSIASPAPTSLTLGFSEDLSLAFSGLTLTGPDGKAVSLGEAALDSSATQLTVPLPAALVPGQYHVDWHALSGDGHKSKGSYSFSVK